MHYTNSTFAFQKRWIIDPAIVPPPDQMNWAMHQLGELRRGQRSKLKRECYKPGMTKEAVLLKKLLWANQQQYTPLANYWFLDKIQVLLLSCSIFFSW